jgi:hypothetical protein
MRTWIGVVSPVIAVSTLIAGLLLSEPKAVLTLKIVGGVSGVIWMGWVTYWILTLRSRALAVGAPTKLEDWHAGWTGARNHSNTYEFRTGALDGLVYLDCFMWTPPDCNGKIYLINQAGRRTDLLSWTQNSTRNNRYPGNLAGGNEGIDAAKAQVIQDAEATPLRIDVSAHVAPYTRYTVEFVYQIGANGAWIKGIRIRSGAQ